MNTRVGVGAVVMAILLAGCKLQQASSPSPTLPPHQPLREEHFPGTIVTPVLSEKIVPGKNVLWCVSFQLAWNELMDLAGGEPIVLTEHPPLADSLNERALDRSIMPQDGVVALAGLVGDNILERVQSEVTAKFGRGAKADLLPGRSTLNDKDVVAYAYMNRSLPFLHEFDEQGISFKYPGSNTVSEGPDKYYEAFGLDQYFASNPHTRELAKNVKFSLSRKCKNRFTDEHYELSIVEFALHSTDDRMILAMVPPMATLGDTVSAVLKTMADPNMPWPSEKIPADEFKANLIERRTNTFNGLVEGTQVTVPVIDINVVKNYRSLLGKAIMSGNSKIQGRLIVDACQETSFRLDRKGAVVTSQGEVTGVWGGYYLIFDRPFLIIIMRNGASLPYFALWVGNDEWLTPARVQEPSMP